MQTWNKRWLKLRTSSGGRLEKYQDEVAAQYNGERTTYELSLLRYVDRIKESKKKHAIQIVLDDFVCIHFALDSGLWSRGVPRARGSQ